MAPPVKTVKDWRREARIMFQVDSSSNSDDPSGSNSMFDNTSTSSASVLRPTTEQEFSSWNGVFAKHVTAARQRRRGSHASSTIGAEILPSTVAAAQVKKLDRSRLVEFVQSNKLYGRQEKLERLVQVYQQISSPGSSITTTTTESPSVVLIGGPAGVGKTCLASQLAAHTNMATGGIYVQGKYDNPAHAMILPYQGIAAACQRICDCLVVAEEQNTAATQERLEQLRDAMGSSVRALGKVVPQLLELMGSIMDDNHRNIVENHQQHHDGTEATRSSVLHPQAVRNRFLFAMTTFLRTVASWGPLVLVLENLQYADEESLKLLDFLASGETIHGLLIVGCYRTSIEMEANNNEDQDLLSNWIQELEQKNGDASNLTRINLSNLHPGTVHEMVADALQMNAESTRELAQLMHKETLGNPLYLKQFIMVLYEKSILDYDPDAQKWSWNIDEVKTEAEAAKDAVDLLRKKMESLPDEMGEVLPLAACFGPIFTARILSVVVEVFQEERRYQKPIVSEETSGAKPWLAMCIENGFIRKVHRSKYTWTHDTIRETALDLVVPDKIHEVRYRLGAVLLGKLSQREISENIFVAANLLNEGLQSKYSKIIDRSKLARLNLEAGKAALASASFSRAIAYLQKGLRCLPPNHWKVEHALSLDLTASMAEAEYCSGDTESMERHCYQIIDQPDLPITDKIRAYDVLIPTRANRSIQGACDMLVDVLKDLGCAFPRFGQMWTVMRGILKLQADTKKYSPKDLVGHKIMTDPAKIYTMAMLDKLSTYSYFTNTLHLPFSILRSFQWTIHYGTCEYSPVAFALGGVILCAQLRDYEAGRRFAEGALSILETNLEYETAEARTIFLTHCFCIHHTMPLEGSLNPLLQGYSSGMTVGDVESACWNIYVFFDFSFYLGKDLASMDRDYETYMSQMRSYDQVRQHSFMGYLRQVIQCLLGLAEDPFSLKGDFFDIESFDAEDKHQVGVIRFRQHDLAAFMCDDEACAELSCMMKKDFSSDELSPGTNPRNFIEAHTAIACYGAARKSKDKSYLAVGKKSHKYIKDLVKKGAMNYEHVELIMDAELAALKGQTDTAIQHFESAISAAARARSVNYQGIASERLADFLAENGDADEAQRHWNQALEFYNEWGAVAKVKQVKSKMTAACPKPESNPPSD